MTASYLAHFLPAPNLVRRLTAALVFLVLAGFAAAQDAPLKGAVYDVPPYGHVESDGSIDGLSVDLWRRAAESLGRQYHLVPVTQMEEVLKGLERKDYDAAIGAITITPARLARVDFSYPAHCSGVAVAVRQDARHMAALTNSRRDGSAARRRLALRQPPFRARSNPRDGQASKGQGRASS